MKLFKNLSQDQKMRIYDAFSIILSIPVALLCAKYFPKVKFISIFSFLIFVNLMYAVFFFLNLAPIREEHARHKKNYNRYQGLMHLLIAYVLLAVCVILNQLNHIGFIVIYGLISAGIVVFGCIFLKRVGSLFQEDE